jgi:hypothetical protein
MANKRDRIMLKCPSEFEDELRKFIDEIEESAIRIADLLTVHNIRDVDEAASTAVELKYDLY